MACALGGLPESRHTHVRSSGKPTLIELPGSEWGDSKVPTKTVAHLASNGSLGRSIDSGQSTAAPLWNLSSYPPRP